MASDPQTAEAERLAATLTLASAEIDVDAAVERGKALSEDEALALARAVLGSLERPG